MSYNQDPVRREERERNQRERQQVSRHSQQRQEDSVASNHQVSASLLFDTPIKKEMPDETSKLIEKTLGDFNQVSKYLMSSDHKQIIGVSVQDIQKKEKLEGDKARVERILKEVRGLPPITGLDDSDEDNNGNLDSKQQLDNRHQSRHDRRDRFDDRSSSGFSDDESSRNNHHHKSKGRQNRLLPNDWGNNRLNESVNHGSSHEPLHKRPRKMSESNLTSSRHHHHHPRSSYNGKNDRNVLNLSGNESSSVSSRSSSSDSDSESASSSSSENESIAEVASRNMSGLEEGDEVDNIMKTADNLQGNDDLPCATSIDSNFPVTATTEVGNPIGSWNLMSFMQTSKNVESSPPREEEEGTSKRGHETTDDKYTKTINKVAVGNFSSPLLSSSSSSGQDSPPARLPTKVADSIGTGRKTNNSLSVPHAPITSEVIIKSLKQSKGNERKGTSSSVRLDEPKTSPKIFSPPRLTSLDCGTDNGIRKLDQSSKSKRSSLAKISPSKQKVPSKENYKPMGQSIGLGTSKFSKETAPKQLICSIDCQMLKRIPVGLNGKKDSSEGKERKSEKKHRDSNGNPCVSPSSSSSQKVTHSSKTSTFFSPKESSKSHEKSDVSSPRGPSCAKRKDPSSSSSPPPPASSSAASVLPSSLPSTNRSHPSQSGPSSGLPFTISGSIMPSSLEPLNSDQDPNNQETSPEFCLTSAKKLKHDADNENERIAKFCKYIESILYFVLTGKLNEQRVCPRDQVIAMFQDTLKLLIHTTGMFMKGCIPTSSTIDNKLIALSHCCQSLIHLKLYRLRGKERYENNRFIKDLKPIVDAKAGEVSIATSSFLLMKKQLELYQSLDQAFLSWNQVESICQKHSSCKAFFDTLDKECTPLSLTSGIDNLVTYVRTGLKILR